MENSPGPPTLTTTAPPFLSRGRFVLAIDEDNDLVGDDDDDDDDEELLPPDDDILLAGVLELVRCFSWDRLPLPFLGIIISSRRC